MSSMTTKPLRKPAPAKAGFLLLVLALATPLVAKWEEVRTMPYQDIIGVWTVCAGETHVEMREYTRAECEAMLEASVKEHAAAIDRLVTGPMTPPRKAALISFRHNVGGAAFARSTLVRKLNAGDVQGACDELRRWVYAGGKRVRGLENRREEERRLCLQ